MDSTDTVIIIPARKKSSRFPGKPLALILGHSLLFRTWKIACAVKGVQDVFIVTDDHEIEQAALHFGAKVIYDDGAFANGSERVAGAVRKLGSRPQWVVNLQGDAVLTPPWVIEAVIQEMKEDPFIQIATPAVFLDQKSLAHFVATRSGTTGTFVTFDRRFNALYFSKTVIPFVREPQDHTPVYRHIGLYGYRIEALEYYQSLAATPLEKTEQLEQLRALENGVPIRVVLVDYRGRTHGSIDHPEDILVVENIINQEGELVL
jgi:3-deoxy-manno-octulosonate cytidylyltransferase (CMP-KDO synthetase)